MLDQIKPGYVLRFGICPSTIVSPGATGQNTNDNTRIEQFPIDRNNLGNVMCISRVSGDLGVICNTVATNLRGGWLGKKIQRNLSYSKFALKHYRTNFDTQEWQTASDFVGYTDGRSLYTVSAGMVFSKDFSGCLMAVYTQGGQRRVAHVASSSIPTMDCKQAFLNRLNNMGNATLMGWFQPYVDARDNSIKTKAYKLLQPYIPNFPYGLVTFGAVNAVNQGYTITAFKPKDITSVGHDWVVTDVRNLPMRVAYNY